MAIKYKREDFRDRAKGLHVHGTPARESDALSRQWVKGPRVLVFSGLIAAFGIFVVGMMLGPSLPYVMQPELEGRGTVARKEALHAGTPRAVYVIHVEVQLADGRRLPAQAATDALGWEQLQPGQEIGVVYQLNREETAVRLSRIHVETPGGP